MSLKVLFSDGPIVERVRSNSMVEQNKCGKHLLVRHRASKLGSHSPRCPAIERQTYFALDV